MAASMLDASAAERSDRHHANAGYIKSFRRRSEIPGADHALEKPQRGHRAGQDRNDHRKHLHCSPEHRPRCGLLSIGDAPQSKRAHEKRQRNDRPPSNRDAWTRERNDECDRERQRKHRGAHRELRIRRAASGSLPERAERLLRVRRLINA